MKAVLFGCGLLAVALMTGCGYQRGSGVPEAYRTINVPAFENNTEYPMAGAMAAQQFLDAIVEDGTFRITSDYKTARLRAQVVLNGLGKSAVRYDRNSVIVPDEYITTLRAKLYVYDSVSGATLVNGKSVTASDTALTRNDTQTGMMDSLPRVSRKLAQNLLAELHSLDVPIRVQAEASAPKPAPKAEPEATEEPTEPLLELEDEAPTEEPGEPLLSLEEEASEEGLPEEAPDSAEDLPEEELTPPQE